MVVAIEKGLDTIKDYFQNKGYQVVTPDSTQMYDAVIYETLHFSRIPPAARTTAKAGYDTGGVLLICARNKTPQEIETMLCQKAYCNLF